MSIIARWRGKISKQHNEDKALEAKHGIRSGDKNWVSPADIEALEEAKVPWLREQRRRARRTARER